MQQPSGVKNKYPKHIKTERQKAFWDAFEIDIENRSERIFLAMHDYLAFCLIYLTQHFALEPADYHEDLIDNLTDDLKDVLIMIGHRSSAKSTHASFAYPMWEAIRAKHHFIILLGDTETQAMLNLRNIKLEFEENALLRNDFPLVEKESRNERKKRKWTENNLELLNGVYILGLSRGGRIRGLRYRQYRPSLIIADDLESIDWVQSQANRDKTERYLLTEVFPAIDEMRAKIVIVGNMLHNDALMARLKKNPRFSTIEFPLIRDEDGSGLSEWERCTWKAKYPNQEALDRQKEKVGEVGWLREYLLKVVSEDGQIVKDTDIRKYPLELLDTDLGQRISILKGGAGVDLAISTKASADCTAIVRGYLVQEDERRVLYVLPHVINKRMGFEQTINEITHVRNTLPLGSQLYVENVAYQQVAIDELEKRNLPVVAMRPITDKRARLETASIYIKNGQVKFPQQGAEDLIMQILNFGLEKHDDMVDALVYLILGMFSDQGGAVISSGNPKPI